MRRTSRPPFDPWPHREPLRAIIDAVAAARVLDARGLDRIVKRHPKAGRGLFSKTEIIAGFRAFGAGDAPISESVFVERLRLRPVRTLSGVTPVTVLTKPFPCPGTCIFCPNDVRMPKSYLADEPGAQRAEDNHFDPYRQTWNRLDAYRSMGHPTDKVELIVLGGTWSHYPEAYQRWFVTRCFEALNDFGAGRDARADAATVPARFDRLPGLRGGELGSGAYNRVVREELHARYGALLHHDEAAAWPTLEARQRENESARARCVGLVFETRPDCIDPEEVRRLRRLGATKVQLGVQSLDDAVLEANKRGHDVATTRRAFRLLRGAGFKIHAHFMPNLLGATPASDVRDYERLFEDPDFRPDELKLYPCLLVESAELARHHAAGEWQPYDDDTLAELLGACIAATPRWCRLTRVVRDFSSHDVAAGTHVANLREVAEARLRAQGVVPREIRSRELRGERPEDGGLRMKATSFRTSAGTDWFLEWVDADDRLAGFLRLTLPRPGDAPLSEQLEGAALIREVHVYGASLPLGRRDADAPQHSGLGRQLVERAIEVAREGGFGRVAVISAVGTRDYYRRLGFADGDLYQHRDA